MPDSTPEAATGILNGTQGEPAAAPEAAPRGPEEPARADHAAKPDKAAKTEAGAAGEPGREGIFEAAKEEGSAEGKDEGKEADGIPEDYGKVDLGIEGLDPAAKDGFAKVARDLKLTAGQMRALAKWQDQFSRETRDIMTLDGIDKLKEELGQSFEPRRQAALNMIMAMDRDMDGEFTKALGRCGALCDPAIVRGFMNLAQAFSEDSLGIAAEGAAPLKTETAYEGLVDAFAKARGKAGK